MKKINWEKQAEQFLKLHNWKIENKVGFHPCFPLGEDFSVKGSKLKFCEEFYKEAFNNYKGFIDGMLIMEKAEETEISEVKLGG